MVPAIHMAEEKEVPFPTSVSKGFFTVIMVLGIIFFVVWTPLMIYHSGRVLDWGVYSVTIVMVLMGLFGRMIYSRKEKESS